jgi:Zinc knuckle
MAGSSRGKQKARDDETQGNTQPIPEDGQQPFVHPQREERIPIRASQPQETQRGEPSNDPLDDELQHLSQEQRDRFLVRTLLTVTRRLEQISDEQNQKRSRSETLDAANESPAPKRTAIKAAELRELYVTKDYTTYCRYVAKVESQSTAAGLSGDDKLNYAITGLDFTEQNLWDAHRKSKPGEQASWDTLKEHLLSRLGDPENRKREAWRALFKLRKRPEQNEYEFLDEFNRRVEEIGQDFYDPTKYAAALFVWQLDYTLRDKMDEQEKLPTDLREITAIAARLRPQIQALAKQRDTASGKQGSQKSNPTRSQGPSGRNPSDKFDKLKSSDKSNSQEKSDYAAKTIEDRDRLAKEDRCFRCGEQGHKSKDCPKKPNSSS